MKVLIVVARRYNGHELWTALMVLQQAGIEFEIVSTATLIEDEVTGEQNTIAKTIEDVAVTEVPNYNGLMIVSGNMADTEAYWANGKVLGYVREAAKNGLAIAAICCSVPTIREVAGGKRVSFYPLVRSRRLLEDAGAVLSTVALSTDGKLVTAEHQMATQMWAENFVATLQEQPPVHVLHDSGYVPKGRARKPIPELERLKRLRAGNVKGSEFCPECKFQTTIQKGRVVCPKCGMDLTFDQESAPL